jgi:hypothetical protein
MFVQRGLHVLFILRVKSWHLRGVHGAKPVNGIQLKIARNAAAMIGTVRRKVAVHFGF